MSQEEGREHEQSPTLADKLDRLFKTAHRAGEHEVSYQEVADAINKEGIATISASYIWDLRKGNKTNPRKAHLEALARYFDVPPFYFYEDDRAVEVYRDLEMMAKLRDSRINDIATRAADLSPEYINALSNIVDELRELDIRGGKRKNQPKQGDEEGE